MSEDALRILLVEDNPRDADLLQDTLAQIEGQLEITHVERLQQATEFLQQGEQADVILLDLGLSDSMGIDTLEQANGAAPHLPIIVLTGLEDEALGTEAVRKGAQDYLVKGQTKPQMLLRAIHHAIERKQMAEALRVAKEDWERTFNSVADLITILDDQHRIVRVNRAMAMKLGVEPDKCVGLPCFQCVHGLQRPVAGCPHTCTIADGSEHTAEVHEERLGGHFLVTTTPMFDAAGKLTGTVHMARDITDRKRHEERILRLSQLYELLSQANEAIVRSRDAETLYAEVCRIVVETGRFAVAWIGQVRGRQVVPLVSSGPGAGYAEEIRVEVDGTLGCGPTGTCIRENRAVINNDFSVNPATSPWREQALRYGLRASAAFPLRCQGKTIGALTLYASEPDAFDAEQVGLLESLSADLSYALDAIDVEQRRIQVERALRESEARYRNLFITMSEGFAMHELICDAEGKPYDYRFLEVNPGFEQATGLKAADVLGCTFRELWPGIEPVWLDRYSRVAISGESDHFEDYYEPTGRWYEVYASRTGQGQFAVAFLNVTDRKRAEEEIAELNQSLQRRLAELQTIFETAPLGLAIAEDETGHHIQGNPANKEMFGVGGDGELSKGGPRPANFRCLQGGRELALTELPMQRAVRGETVTGQIIDAVREDGKTITVYSSASPLFDETGKPRGAVGAFLDITPLKRAEERTRLLSEITAQLLASDQPQQIVESLCRQVMDHLGCHVFFNFLVDEPSNRLQLNACAGIPEEAIRQIEWLDIGTSVCGCAARDGCRIVAEHIQTTLDPRADLVRSFGVLAYACHPLMVQGHTLGTLSFGSRLKPTFADDELALMKTVADHVAIAMQRIRLLESLERHARTAEAANKAKSQFLANMSHELRTPMNAILGMIDVALPKATDPTVKDCLQTARGSADVLLTLLNDLLDSARIESGKLELELAPFSLRQVLDQIMGILAVRASEKGLCCQCIVPDGTPDAVLGDRMRLQQVLLNLGGNAIKFTEHGGVEIMVRTLPQDGDVCLEFAVQDSGIGIPPSVQDRLFQPFTQADASMARRFGGTGLGLSICKGLVEMMDGHIWVKSEPGKGSTFYFTVRMPLVRELPQNVEASAAVVAAAYVPLRILLAEDNPANQKLAGYILQDRGHLIEIAGNGQEAIYLTEQNRYDVILMDVQMPIMDGLEATAMIRKREDGDRRVPIIAMTAHAMRGDRDRCLAAGMDGYIAKPISPPELIGLVERLAAKAEEDRQRWEATELPSSALETAAELPANTFNLQEALKSCFNSRMFWEMVEFFFTESIEMMNQMHAALKDGNAEAVGRAAHRLRGTILYLGANRAMEAALQVEEAGMSGDLTAVAEALGSLDTQIQLLKQALPPNRQGKQS